MPALNPFQFDPSQFTQANTNLQSAFQNAQNSVSARSQDTAAARVRSRIEGQNQGAVNAINEAGTRNIGGLSRNLDLQRRSSQGALASGLADVDADFNKRRLDAAQIAGQIGGLQGGLANQFNQAGIAANTQAANQAIGLQNADANTFTADTQRLLGVGDQAIRRDQLGEEVRRNQQRELLDFFSQFAQSGATLSESPAFNERFQALIAQLFGTQGLQAGAGDPNQALSVGAINGTAPGTVSPISSAAPILGQTPQQQIAAGTAGAGGSLSPLQFQTLQNALALPGQPTFFNPITSSGFSAR